jgi:RNA polymerase sigma-70 factor (ECF subfamily)
MVTSPDRISRQLPRRDSVLIDETAYDDSELAVRARRGDTRAFDVLVERHRVTLYNVVLRVLRNHDDAVDVVQTAFARAWDRLDTFDPSRRFFSWLYRIALNAAINARAKERVSTDIDDLELTSPEPSPDEAVASLERSAAIERALARLPEHYRQVVLLRHFADLSYVEIAHAVGVEPKTVKSRLYTARACLAVLLRDHRDEMEA